MVKFELTKEEYLDIIVDSFENGKIANYNKFMKYMKGVVLFSIHVIIIVSFLILIFLDYYYLFSLIILIVLFYVILAVKNIYSNRAYNHKYELENRLNKIKSYLVNVKNIVIEIYEKEINCQINFDNGIITETNFNIKNIELLENHDENVEIHNKENDFVFIPFSLLESKVKVSIVRKFNWNFKDAKKAESF